MVSPSLRSSAIPKRVSMSRILDLISDLLDGPLCHPVDF